MFLLTSAQPSLEPKSMFMHQPLPPSLLQVINLALGACFETAFELSIHEGKGHQDMTACLLNKRVILMASAGHLLLEYALFFQSNTRRLYIPVLLYHGIWQSGTSHVPTPRCGKYGLTSTTWVILFWILFI